MCSNGLMRMLREAKPETTPATPATTLIAHPDLETKTSAEVQGLAPSADAA